jgi:hypothetical protein
MKIVGRNKNYFVIISVCIIAIFFVSIYKKVGLESSKATNSNVAEIYSSKIKELASENEINEGDNVIDKSSYLQKKTINGFTKPYLPESKVKEFYRVVNKIDELRSDLGMYSSDDLAEYEGHNEESLLNLVKVGDRKAIAVLARRKLKERKFEEALMLNIDGIIRGSIEQIYVNTQIYSEMAVSAKKNGDLEGAANYEKLASVWMEVSELRGKKNPVENVSKSSRSAQADSASKGVSIAALNQFRALEEERIRLGLKEFNNNAAKDFDAALNAYFAFRNDYRLPYPHGENDLK